MSIIASVHDGLAVIDSIRSYRDITETSLHRSDLRFR